MNTMALSNTNHIPAKADTSVRFTDEQFRVIAETCCGGAKKHEVEALIAIAETRGLNPILGECYFVQRWDQQSGGMKWSVQASIDSFRIKAEQTGLYAGQDEPEFEYDSKGQVTLARVRVYRKDWPRPAVGVARWTEYVQTKKDGQPTKFWEQMPHNQLAKCAEALALRKAFPVVLSKIYTVDEMQQADNPAPYVETATAPKQMGAPVPVVVDDRMFAGLCERVDSAESATQLNAIAKDAMKAQKVGAISSGNFEALKGAVTRKRGMLGTPAPKSEPKVGDLSEHDAGEADYEAQATAVDS